MQRVTLEGNHASRLRGFADTALGAGRILLRVMHGASHSSAHAVLQVSTGLEFQLDCRD